MSSSTTPVRPSVPARAVWIPLLVSLVCVLAGLGLVWGVRAELPDPVARHWSADGTPDGFSSLRVQLAVATLFPLLLSGIVLALGAGTRQLRALGPVAAGLAAFVSVVLFGSTWAQRGQQAATATDVNWPAWAGAGAGLLCGLLVWLTTRDTAHHVATATPAVDAPRIRVAPGTTLAWTGSTRASTGVWVSAVLGLLPMLVMGAVFWAMGNRSMGLFMLALEVPMALLLSALRCRVTIDARGVRAMGLGLVPWVRLPLEQIEEATIGTASPMGDFGGWGYRGRLDGSGAWGLVTAEGEALVLERAGKGPLYVTVDRAREAAGVVNTLISRSAR
ncbi:DUF1648 domain-containing protein [Luteococcus peritonei]|uniref:DUF1648 domain-containing protein n=1 Tax=Luteococcus peritonei TaxID=88874 RepID=A0ABW4RS86_9ACTN